MSESVKQYRARVKAGLAYIGMTQGELARRLGIGKQTLSRKMNGMPFTEFEMLRIARIIGWKEIGGEDI